MNGPAAPQRIRLALDALRADVLRWHGMVDELRAARAPAGIGVLIDPTVFAFAGRAVATAHDSLRARLARMVAAGAATSRATARAADEPGGVAVGHRLGDIR